MAGLAFCFPLSKNAGRAVGRVPLDEGWKHWEAMRFNHTTQHEVRLSQSNYTTAPKSASALHFLTSASHTI